MDCSNEMMDDTYKPPKQSHLLKKIACVYAWTLFTSTWTLLGCFPYRANLSSGLACVPVPYDKQSERFFWLVAAPALMVAPLGVVVWVVVDSWIRGISSVSLWRLIMFFVRLMLIFIIMWEILDADLVLSCPHVLTCLMCLQVGSDSTVGCRRER